MAKPRKSSSVPGQALGFSLQFTKMTELLARPGVGNEVEFEGLDDLSVKTPDGHLTLYQAKSALESNPLSDRSISFWKCLANWADTVAREKITADKLRLVFYVSNPVPPGPWARSFDHARNEAEADAAMTQVYDALWGPAPSYPLRNKVAKELAPEAERFFAASELVRRTVVLCFSLEIVKDDIHADLAAVVRFVDPRRHADVVSHACAWTKRRVDGLIAEGKPARIGSDEFQREMVAYIRKFNERAILRTFAPAGPSQQEAEQLRLKTFVRQLEFLGLDYTDQMEAISDFYRAAIDRTQLGDSGEVHSSSFDNLDSTLTRSWKNIARQQEIMLEGHPDEARGEVVYRECVKQHVLVENLQPLDHFIPGCYHLLADNAKLGWHPRYEQLLKAVTIASAEIGEAAP